MRFIACVCFALACLAQEPTPLATVAGQPIHERDLLPQLQPQLRQLRAQEFELKSRALENAINQKLLEAEARKTETTPEKLLAAIDAKIAEPTVGELEAFYLGQKDRLNRPFDEIRAQLHQNLKQSRIQDARQAYFKTLRANAQVSILLRAPKIEVGYDAARVRGNSDAPVTIVEFSDFQCPYCRQVQGALKEVTAKYEGRVKLAFRDFPLRQIHPQAQSAAEASRCAGEQGKFWEYHDLLFSQAAKLDKAGLAALAASVGLDAARFEACVASGKFQTAIERDLQEGMQAGVTGTPGFIVNGILSTGAQSAAAFEKVIEAELAAGK